MSYGDRRVPIIYFSLSLPFRRACSFDTETDLSLKKLFEGKRRTRCRRKYRLEAPRVEAMVDPLNGS